MTRPIVVRGDARALPLPDASVDCIVTDPPYGLEFMGKEWDRFAGATSDRDFKGLVLSQQRTRNVKCPDCGKWAYDHPGRLCECGGIRRAQVTAFQGWCEQWAAEALRVLKPGGHLLAFGGTRTYHRLTCAIEDAGFEIRDSIGCLTWCYASGFPKSLDVSKAIDRQRAEDREPVDAVRAWLNDRRVEAGLTLDAVNRHFGHASNGGGSASSWMTNPTSRALPTWEQWLDLQRLLRFGDDMDAEVWRLNGRKGTPGDAWADREVIGEGVSGIGAAFGDGQWARGAAQRFDLTAPATENAARWQGWGTALKPAWEPIVVARRPLAGTVAGNVLAYGTGAINVDACRTETSDDLNGGAYSSGRMTRAMNPGGAGMRTTEVNAQFVQPAGRWPPNLVFVHYSCDYYALRHDVDPGTAEAVRAYYRGCEAVRPLRGGLPGDAVGAGETEVLQPGLLERGAPGDGPGREDPDGVPPVRDGVRGVPGVGPIGAAEVLFGRVPSEGEPAGSHRPPAQPGVPGEDGPAAGDPGTVVTVEGRPVRRRGLPLRDGGAAATGADGPGDADGQGSLHPAAPGGGSRDAGPSTDPSGDRAPRQRGEAGQPAGEPGGDQQPGSLPGTPGDHPEVRDADGRGGNVAGGERGFEVPAHLIPAGWRDLFTYSSTEACQQVGERTAPAVRDPGRRGPGGVSTGGHAGQDTTDPRAGGDQVVPVMECVPGCPVAELDTQSGNRPTGAVKPYTYGGAPERIYGGGRGYLQPGQTATFVKDADSGGASRFYPVFRFNPKADTWERPTLTREGAGEVFDAGRSTRCAKCGKQRVNVPGSFCVCAEPDFQPESRPNVISHPTVKPVDLMRWLVRLVCPPGGLVADLFAGSGATLQAAQVEGFRSVGIEMDADHCRLITERLSWPVRIDRDDRFERIRPVKADPDQGVLDLFGGDGD